MEEKKDEPLTFMTRRRKDTFKISEEVAQKEFAKFQDYYKIYADELSGDESDGGSCEPIASARELSAAAVAGATRARGGRADGGRTTGGREGSGTLASPDGSTELATCMLDGTLRSARAAAMASSSVSRSNWGGQGLLRNRNTSPMLMDPSTAVGSA